MNTKFTKGQWTIDFNGTVGHIKAVGDSADKTPTVAIYNIFSKYGGEIAKKHEAEEKANAKLIASAPGLLDSCISALNTFYSIGCNDDAEIVKVLKEAIKKATE